MKKQLLLLVIMLLPMVASADAVEVNIDGILYELVSKANEAKVIRGADYYGDIVIPKIVEYEGTSYIVTGIGERAFYGCSSLASVSIPNSVTTIGRRAFDGCSGLSSIIIPNSVTSIGEGVFCGCSSMFSVTIPNSVTSIVKNAFRLCSGFTSFVIPNCVTSIEEGAFWGCSSLTSVTIGENVCAIGPNSLANCQELTDVYCLAKSVPDTDSDAFIDSYIGHATLHVPAASLEKYTNATPWKNFQHIVAIDNDEIPPTQKCATPTIHYQNGKLSFCSDTEGVNYVSEIEDADIKRHYDKEIQMTATYIISVYATKTGYYNSDIAKATLCWIDSTPQTEGITNVVAQVSVRAVMIQSDGCTLNIWGAEDGTPINVYSVDGTQVGSAVSSNGLATVNTTLEQSCVAILKIGQKSVKVVVK